jgi:hypothetical protein
MIETTAGDPQQWMKPLFPQTTYGELPSPTTSIGILYTTNPFDADKDYYAELTSEERWKEGDSEYPLLRGLQRIAHKHRGGIQIYSAEIINTPSRDNPIAAVKVVVIFKDGTQFSGVADATPTAHKAPYSHHLVAVAESKAASRAFRQAFNISKATREEIGQPEDESVTDAQLNAIKNLSERKKINEKAALALIKSKKSSADELTKDEASTLIKALNK